ncbi:uncharacterized protein TNCV_354791 [Trichonephila clavipes]|uniref:Uncharacterized protein n=1 Tax=Trichonephila clavipes TaxID=2585209 RepID=A0A8X7BC04_TRICX|nr:uncharacterized protein TNCV_354791 [Trichonephila clavipes]
MHLWISLTPNAAVLFVDVAIQPEVRFIAKQNSLMKIGNNDNFVLGPFDESTPCLMIVLMNCQTKLRINHLTAVKSVAILETQQALQTVTFTQDGALPHIDLPVQRLLRSKFVDDRIISHYFNHHDLTMTFDLTPCDFWQREILMPKVYCDQSVSLTALKNAIRQNLSIITQEILLNAMNGVVIRFTGVLLNDGQHIEHLLQ